MSLNVCDSDILHGNLYNIKGKIVKFGSKCLCLGCLSPISGTQPAMVDGSMVLARNYPLVGVALVLGLPGSYAADSKSNNPHKHVSQLSRFEIVECFWN